MFGKISKYFLSMHYVTIVVLLVVAIVENIDRGFPVNLLTAVLVTTTLDLAIKILWLKRKPALPLSAIITGLIIGTVTPFNNSVLGAAIPSVLAIFSKFIIRFKGRHLFNPAVLGVVTAMILFNSIASHAPPGATDHMSSGASVGGFAVSLLLVPFLLYANYTARRMWVAIPNLTTSALLYYFTGLVSPGSLIGALPYYFSFIIASEPKTSPNTRNAQVVFGVGIAIISVLPFLLGKSYSHVGALAALLLGNLMYAIYRGRTQ